MKKQPKFWEKDPIEEHIEDKLIAIEGAGATNPTQFTYRPDQISYATLSQNFWLPPAYGLTSLEEKIINILG